MKTRQILPLAVMVVLMAGIAGAQIRITDTRVVETPSEGMWGYARFSPDGTRLFFSTLSYNGIWSYDISTRQVSEVTRDEGSGFGFSISPDGGRVAYRRTVPGERWIDRTQEVVVQDLRSGTQETVGSARKLSPPAHIDNSVTYTVGSDLLPAPPKKNGVFLQGIRDRKILLVVNGTERTIDPLGGGSYIWPSLSPDKSLILAYDMDHGTIISTADGQLRQRLGRAEGAVWTRDGRWVIYFSEQNDGYRITGGELNAVRPDGSDRTSLTDTPDRIELFPSCSPTENRIVCHTLDGKLLLMTYTVTQ